MEITAKITGIRYKPFITKTLKTYSFVDFDINTLPASCIIDLDGFTFGLSKWVSPKRTRSYPYERVYNTLGTSKRITVIPVLKDEGKDGDRDFLQWDTISLMSLLDVFVVLSYYNNADKSSKYKNKITNQQFDNEFVKQKIFEIKNYHSSALHWNLKECGESLAILVQKSKSAYQKIANKLGVEFHNEQGLDNFIKIFKEGVDFFMNSSRQKAKNAQLREIQTTQTKEVLSSSTKTLLTIDNFLGGKYFFTVDETKIEKDNIFLVEAKHTSSANIPSVSDIKDGLLKMILYTNLKNVKILGKKYNAKPILLLTSSKLKNEITFSNINEIDFISEKERDVLKKLYKEAKENNFELIIQKV